MEHGIRISVREAVEPYAVVVVSGARPGWPGYIAEPSRLGESPAETWLGESPSETWLGATAELKATIYGPKCAYARTLPTTFLPSARSAGEIEFLVQDPCYWTPALPFLYELSIDLTDLTGKAATVRQAFGLRRLAARQRGLYLEGKRFVPRGLRASAITAAALQQARTAEVALIVPAPPDEALTLANVQGVPIIADLRGANSNQGAWAGGGAANFPSVLMRIIAPNQIDDFVRSGAADGLMALVVGPDDEPPRPAATTRGPVIALELGPGDRPPDWVATCGRPVIAIRRGGTYADFQEARSACDRLQADLAPEFDLAGYFV